MAGSSTFLIVRGIIGILVGIVAFARPGLTIAFLVLVFGAYALIDGLTNVMVGLTNTPRHHRSWAMVLQGLVGIAVGILAGSYPAIRAARITPMAALRS